jgi:multidrug efflux pump subunit AcrB
MGISSNDAAQALRIAFAGIEVGDWVDPTGETRDVAVRLHPDDRVSKENIERLPIAISGTNQMVPLDQIATISMGKGLPALSTATANGRSPFLPMHRVALTVK